jgi:hypothetical protein
MPPGLPGDRYCEACDWLFAVEMLQGEDPMWLDETLKCRLTQVKGAQRDSNR